MMLLLAIYIIGAALWVIVYVGLTISSAVIARDDYFSMRMRREASQGVRSGLFALLLTPIWPIAFIMRATVYLRSAMTISEED